MAGCPVCGGPLVTDLQRGEVVCAQCGLVVEGVVDMGPERHVFDEREKKRVRTALLTMLAEAAGTTPTSVRNAAKRLRV